VARARRLSVVGCLGFVLLVWLLVWLLVRGGWSGRARRFLAVARAPQWWSVAVIGCGAILFVAVLIGGSWL